jgi:hypothetical protein
MSSHLSKLASLSSATAVVADTQAPAQSRKAALRAAWKAHSVKRALAAVASASDADYEAFGWDRCALMAKLRWLRDDIACPAADQLTPVVTLVTAARTAAQSNGATTKPNQLDVTTRGG